MLMMRNNFQQGEVGCYQWFHRYIKVKIQVRLSIIYLTLKKTWRISSVKVTKSDFLNLGNIHFGRSLTWLFSTRNAEHFFETIITIIISVHEAFKSKQKYQVMTYHEGSGNCGRVHDQLLQLVLWYCRMTTVIKSRGVFRTMSNI